VLAVFGGDISTVNYTSYDLAADTVALMDAIGWDSAHVLGHSMGAGIAQLVATEYPERVRTLTLFGGAPFDGVSGRADDRFVAFVITPVADDDEARWQRTLESYRIVFEPAIADEDDLIAYSRRQFDRAQNPRMQCVTASRAAQEIALASSPTHDDKLRALPHRTLVLHGTGDLAVAFDGGEVLAALIPDAKLIPLDGMGHMTIEPKYLSTMARAIIEHALD
jgi:pimeloyl-ACP methyl ester carboxylesterase